METMDRPRRPSAGVQSNSEHPEIPFPPEWGSLVRRARMARKLSQADLAELVDVDQPMISYIENGQVLSSKAVIPLVHALNIPPPRQYFEDELEERWVESGRVLRRRNEAGFRGLLAAAEQMIASADDVKEH